nr:urea ABC transporter ATP-binding subunit UrtE [Solimonas flava]
MSETTAILQIKSLNQFYGGSHTLWDVDLDVARGSITCLMGRNGMGKTTLLRSVMGLVGTASGQIVYDGGTELRTLGAEQRAALGIGFVPQGREIFSQLSVEENLRMGLIARRERPPDALERVYATFPVLKQMLRRRGGDLSGGQQQQLAIGRALLLQPRLLILDEPCEGIQPNIVHEIGDLLIRLNRETGLSVLIVEQKLPFARRVASEFRVLDKGRLVAGGPIAGLSDEIVRQHLTV